jgi:cell division septum initiation protein DivIVA
VRIQQLVQELASLIEEAKSMPLSQSCIVNRNDLLDLLSEIQNALPAELSQATSILNERESVIQDSYKDADRIIEIAKAEARALVAQEAVYKEALIEAEALRKALEEELGRKRLELDDYVDAKLAAFEANLVKTLNQIQTIRERTTVRLQPELLHDTQVPPEFFDQWDKPEQ